LYYPKILFKKLGAKIALYPYFMSIITYAPGIYSWYFISFYWEEFAKRGRISRREIP
jgi:hypothetical protein